MTYEPAFSMNAQRCVWMIRYTLVAGANPNLFTGPLSTLRHRQAILHHFWLMTSNLNNSVSWLSLCSQVMDSYLT
jgi:hypothetical protein